LIDRFGALDPTSGGDTSRVALSAAWSRADESGGWRAQAWALRYELDLFSNFSYFAADPVNGGQFEQVDRRNAFGGQIERRWNTTLAGRSAGYTLAAGFRYDDIDEVGLHLTSARQRLSTIRSDAVKLSGLWTSGEATLQWNPWLRTVAGLRVDQQRARVSSDTAVNSDRASDALVAPKLQAVFGPFAHTELYAGYGHGFHSNDARGATIRINPDPRDPEFGNPVERVPLLVRAKGAELGVRGAWLPGLQTAVALWSLDLGSELVFIGDAGTTEANRASRRRGIEIANYYTPAPGWVLDADLAFSRARFRGEAPEGNRIPGAIERTASAGLTFDRQGALYGGLRLRYFGARPLIEDNSVRSGSSTLLNARAGWRVGRRAELVLDVLNLTDRAVNDIEYFYESQLAGELAPVADRHFHPAEPRTVRLAVRVNFD
jgi:outer membrane receptor for monomeric catechols